MSTLDPAPHMRPGRIPVRTLLIIWCIPSAIAVLQQALVFGMRGMVGQEWPWILFQFPKWLSWAVVTPIILKLVDRYPAERGRMLRSAAAHALAAILIAIAFEFAWIGPTMLLERATGNNVVRILTPTGLQQTTQTMSMRFLNSVLPRLSLGVVTYAAVAGLAMSLRYGARLRDREIAAARLEAELAVAQVQALKMQVHPHFLFNTLHAITVLIREDRDAAIRTVTQLGDLLRSTLSRAAATEVPLRQELDTLQLFLDIEATRFADRLRVSYDIDDDVLEARVPDLILQPLVENAIRHGIERRAGPGMVQVSARRSGDRVVMEVADDGVGLPDDGSLREGVGLATTRARLNRLYGAAHEIGIQQGARGGCTVRITIPCSLQG